MESYGFLVGLEVELVQNLSVHLRYSGELQAWELEYGLQASQ